MSGVKHAWLGGEFVQLHVGLLEALGGDYETAAVIWCVKYHAGVGSWAATREEFQRATALTRHKLDRALRRARDEGYLRSEGSHGTDRTLTWSIVYADEPTSAHVPESGTSDTGKRHQPVPESGISSSSRRTTTEGGRAKRAAPLPEGFEPNETCSRLAAELRLDVDSELAAFRDHALANGKLQKDWQATFRTWLRNSAKWAAERGQRAAGGQQWASLNGEGLTDEQERALDEWLWTHPVHGTDELDDLALEDTAAWQAEMKRLGALNRAEGIRVVKEEWGI